MERTPPITKRGEKIARLNPLLAGKVLEQAHDLSISDVVEYYVSQPPISGEGFGTVKARAHVLKDPGLNPLLAGKVLEPKGEWAMVLLTRELSQPPISGEGFGTHALVPVEIGDIVINVSTPY